MNIKPIGYRVVLRQEKENQKTQSGILLNSKKEILKNIAKVEAMGSEAKEYNYGVKVGDKVIFDEKNAKFIDDENVKFIVLDIENIMGIID